MTGETAAAGSIPGVLRAGSAPAAHVGGVAPAGPSTAGPSTAGPGGDETFTDTGPVNMVDPAPDL